MSLRMISDTLAKCEFIGAKCTDKCRYYKTCVHSVYKRQK
jgi:hypothetical protein